jgi:hypothetical protein
VQAAVDHYRRDRERAKLGLRPLEPTVFET